MSEVSKQTVTGLIVIEGLDGSGKDTILSELLPQFYQEGNSSVLFRSKYQKVARTREPTQSSESGRWLIKRLVDGTLGEATPYEVATNYIEDRVAHSKEIATLKNFGYLVLTSRYDLSTYAYQGSQGLDFEELYLKHQYGPQGALIPDLTILVDVSVDTALSRIAGRSQTREFFEKKQWLEKIHRNYHQACEALRAKDGRCIEVVSGEGTREACLEKVEGTIKKYFAEKFGPEEAR